MRRLAGLFHEQEAFAGQAMPKPFKLAAYVDYTGDARRLPPALVNVLFVAFGVTTVSASIAPSVLKSDARVDEHVQTSALPYHRGTRTPTRFGNSLPLAALPDHDSRLTTASGGFARPLPVLLRTEVPGASGHAANQVAVGNAIPVRDTGSRLVSDRISEPERAGSRPEVPIRSAAPSVYGEPITFAAAAQSNLTEETTRSTTPVMATTIFGGEAPANGWDDEAIRNAPSQSAGAVAERVSNAVEPSAGAQTGVGERNVRKLDPVAPRQTSRGVEFEVATSFNGVDSGRIALVLEDSILGEPDRVSENISVRLGDIINLLAPRMDPGLLGWLTSSEHAEQYLTLNDLRAHGISVSFDAKDRLVFRAI